MRRHGPQLGNIESSNKRVSELKSRPQRSFGGIWEGVFRDRSDVFYSALDMTEKYCFFFSMTEKYCCF